MEDKKAIPQIRFKGYTGAWQSCRLGDISNRVDRKNARLESTLPLTISAQYGLVDQMSYFNSQIASKNISNYYLLKKGEFAYNRSTSQDYPVGAVKRLDKYDQGVLSTLYIVFNPEDEISSDFLVAYYDSNYWHNEIKIRAAEGARNHGLLNISASDFFDARLTIPLDVAEQKKIGAFILHIEELISKKQKELEKINNFKQAMLEKMFAKDGADVPEVRFPGFNTTWERNLLNHYLETSTEKNEQNLFSKADVLSVSSEFGIVNQIEHKGRSFAGVSVTKYGIVNNGDVVYTKSPLRDTPYGIIKANMGKAGIASILYAVYRPKKDTYPPFVQYFFELNGRLNKYLRPLISKGAKNIINISDDSALLGTVIFPGYKEQRQIGEFFLQLDALIGLNRKALNKLRILKKSLLEKMFI